MSLAADFIQLFYPRYCHGCQRTLVAGENVICTHCLAGLPKTDYHRLPENPVWQRLANRIPVTQAFAYLKFRKGGIVQRLLHQLKYNHHPEIGVALGHLVGREVKSIPHGWEIIVPVPLHESRRRRRGYNQSAQLARGLSEALGIPWDESISIRTQRTETQTKRNRLERWRNVEHVFAVTSSDAIQGKHVLLVDDVITTGATVEACGRHLLEHGARQLSVVCIAEAQ